MKKFFITLTVLFAAALGANAQFSIGAGYLNRTNKISFEGTSNSYTLNVSMPDWMPDIISDTEYASLRVYIIHISRAAL